MVYLLQPKMVVPVGNALGNLFVAAAPIGRARLSLRAAYLPPLSIAVSSSQLGLAQLDPITYIHALSLVGAGTNRSMSQKSGARLTEK
ncbi:hypothetical protein A5906_09445 [Bradyrhizobium sacchari]|uniref:hypothetical protein n=1 Tax=Bradyrhizobium sacchari TaxID=1399419 RepID=UPI0009B1221A|nr:hypothetical protein [Bradyrhizobium sacchari]OPY95263.1 hypothetical protein A5906_09445 [Bradyrhizobium sacchari]